MGKSAALLLVLVFLTALCLIAAKPVKAGSRTIVVPDDYSTIVAAIANAKNGDTIFIRKGTYEGAINQTVLIDKSLSIVGESAESTILNMYPAYNVTWLFATPFFSYSDAITITTDDCKLLNLTIIIANPGGYISATGNRTQIIGNKITVGPSTGVAVNGSYCKITDNVMGGRVQLNGFFNEIARNSLSYIHLDGSWNIIKDNVCEHLGLGYYSNNTSDNAVSGNRIATSSRSFSGIDLEKSNNNFLCKNIVSGFSYGFWLWFSSGNTITANTIADSLSASISFGGSSNNTIYLNNLIDNMWGWIPYVYDHYTDPNARAADPNMTVSTNFWDNSKEGNYWDNYNGSDVNGDGIGDTPYEIYVNNQDNFPLMASVEIESVSTELPEWASPSLNPSPAPSLNPTPEPEPQTSESFPTALVIAVSGASMTIVVVGLLGYFKKRKH